MVTVRRAALTVAHATGPLVDRCCARPYRGRAVGSPAARACPSTRAAHSGLLRLVSSCTWSLGEQADVPAEQPATGEDARLPPAHAHPRRQSDPGFAPGQGPHAALGLTTPRQVLPAAARMRRRAEFSSAVRTGSRAGAPALVVHFRQGPRPEAGGEGRTADAVPATVGFIVSRSVGGAVARNRVRRRLRHLVRERLGALPAGSRLVVRATPAAATTPAPALAAQLDRTLARVLGLPVGTVLVGRAQSADPS